MVSKAFLAIIMLFLTLSPTARSQTQSDADRLEREWIAQTEGTGFADRRIALTKLIDHNNYTGQQQ
jgi:hypothetical protein